jgi:hypothetical protein
MSGLQQLLGGFAGRVNAQASLRTALAGWSPQFFIQAPDSGETFQVHIAAGQVQGVSPVDTEPGDEALLLRGDSALLASVFSGQRSPLGAYTDGELEVYGSTKDQIKLDVIALVLWGA